MRLSDIGEYANQFWNEITNHFPFVILDSFVVMPNHIHGIVIIDKPYDGKKSSNGATDDAVDGTPGGASDGGTDGSRDVACNVSTTTTPTTTTNTADNMDTNNTNNNTNFGYHHKNQQMANIPPKSGSLSTIIRSYKSVVTKNARKIHPDFEWQSRFNDHIIRNKNSFQRIRNYIINNPRNWDNDKFN